MPGSSWDWYPLFSQTSFHVLTLIKKALPYGPEFQGARVLGASQYRRQMVRFVESLPKSGAGELMWRRLREAGL